MAYHRIDPRALDPLREDPCETYDLKDGAGFETLGFRLYRADPGEQLPLAYHYHDEQEEAFYVLEGPLHVETPEGEYRVPTGEAFLVAPGNAHRAHNPEDAAGPIEVLAMGAPSIDDGHRYVPEDAEEP